MPPFTSTTIAICAFAVIIAYAARGTSGFGGNLIAIPLMSLVVPIQTVVPALTALTLLSCARLAWTGRSAVRWGEVRRVLPWTLLGVAVGLYMFAQLHDALLAKALGAFLMGYAVYGSLARSVPPLDTSARPMSHAAAFGTTGGAVGTVFGTAGPFFAVYFGHLRGDRDAFRTTVTSMTFIHSLARVPGYAAVGVVDSASLWLFALVLPFMWIGDWLSDLCSKRVSDKVFQWLVTALVFGSGLALVLK